MGPTDAVAEGVDAQRLFGRVVVVWSFVALVLSFVVVPTVLFVLGFEWTLGVWSLWLVWLPGLVAAGLAPVAAWRVWDRGEWGWYVTLQLVVALSAFGWSFVFGGFWQWVAMVALATGSVVMAVVGSVAGKRHVGAARVWDGQTDVVQDDVGEVGVSEYVGRRFGLPLVGLGAVLVVAAVGVGWWSAQPDLGWACQRDDDSSGCVHQTQLDIGDSELVSADVSNDGKTVVAGLHNLEDDEVGDSSVVDSSVVVFDVASGEQQRTLFESDDVVQTVRFSPDGSLVVADVYEIEEGSGFVVVLDTETGEEINRFWERSCSRVLGLSVDHETAECDGRLLDVESGELFDVRGTGYDFDGPPLIGSSPQGLQSRDLEYCLDARLSSVVTCESFQRGLDAEREAEEDGLGRSAANEAAEAQLDVVYELADSEFGSRFLSFVPSSSHILVRYHGEYTPSSGESDYVPPVFRRSESPDEVQIIELSSGAVVQTIRSDEFSRSFGFAEWSERGGFLLLSNGDGLVAVFETEAS